jgi:two-component system, chemotaxis family, sensor kinase Cph1
MSNSSADKATSFAHRIALLQQGEHLCSIYAEFGEMLTQVVPYIKTGLLNGERCIYVADENNKEDLVHALRFWGLDAELAMNRGQLVFWTRHDYRQPGTFDLNRMLDFVRGTLDKAVADGHHGIRLAVEMSWTINNGISDADLVRWESFINTISFAGSNVSFLCQYNSRLLSASLIAKAVHVHPVVLLGQDICPNRFYCSATDVLTAQNHDNLDSLLIKINPPDSPHSNLKAQASLERASEPA